MAVPFQRATLIAIMRMYAENSNLAIRSLEMPAEGGGGGGGRGAGGSLEAYAVSRESVERSVYSADDRLELEEMQHLSLLTALSHDQISQAAKVP